MVEGEQPPFAAWSKQDVARMRKDHPTARLSEPSWTARFIEESKDIDYLLKKRKGGGKGKDNKEE